MRAAKKPTCSARRVAYVFGVTSANINITSVNMPVATAIPASPSVLSAIMVAIADARMLTKLFPSNISPMSRSGCSSNFEAEIAPLLPLLAKCRRRYRFIVIKAVSEPEKNPETRISSASIP